MVLARVLWETPSTLERWARSQTIKMFKKQHWNLRNTQIRVEEEIKDVSRQTDDNEKSVEALSPRFSESDTYTALTKYRNLRFRAVVCFILELFFNYWAAGLIASDFWERAPLAILISLLPAYGFWIVLENIFATQKSLTERFIKGLIGATVTAGSLYFVWQFLLIRSDLFQAIIESRTDCNCVTLTDGFKIASAIVGIVLPFIVALLFFQAEEYKKAVVPWIRYYNKKSKLANLWTSLQQLLKEIELQIELLQQRMRHFYENLLNKIKRRREFWKRLGIKLPDDDDPKLSLPLVPRTFFPLVFIFFHLGCDDGKLNEIQNLLVQTQKPKCIHFLVDVSSSNEINLSKAPRILSRVIDQLRGRDQILVQPIDGKSETRAETIAKLEMPEDLGPSDFFLPSYRTKLKMVISSIDSLIRSRDYKNETDILGVLLILELDTAHYEEHIVLLSDGVNCSPELNMYLTDDLSGRMNNMSIPNLQGARIYFLGPTDSRSINAKRFHQIEFFWREYFDQSKAKLMAYSFDPEKTLNKLKSLER